MQNRRQTLTKPPAPPALTLAGFLAVTVSLRMKPGDKLPDEFVAVPWGTTDGGGRGAVICNEETLANFRAVQAQHRLDHVMLDFNHNTLPGSVEKEPRAKAAKLTANCVQGVGIVCRVDYWTPEGLSNVGGGHYPDLSPAVWRDERGVVMGLHSVAACEHGQLKAAGLELFSAAQAAEATKPKPNNKMDYKKILCALLGLPDDATDEQIAAAQAVEAKEPDAMHARPARTDHALAAFMAETRTALKTLTEAQAAVLQSAVEAKIDGFIAVAAHAGKEVKLDRATLHGFGAAGAQKYLDSLVPGVVPVSGASQSNRNVKRANGNGSAPDAKLHGFSAEEAKIITDAGLSLEDAAKARDTRAGVPDAVIDDDDEEEAASAAA